MTDQSTALERVEAADVEHRNHMNRVIRTADVIASSGLLRDDLTPEDARAIAITLDQMGVPPGLLNINAGYVVKGKVDFMTRIWTALAARAGYRVWPDDASDDKTGIVHILNERTGVQSTVTFAWEDAAKAGLTNSDTYKKYGRDMLIWRAMKRAVGWHASEVIAGMGDPGPDVVPRARARPIPTAHIDPDDEPVDAEIIEQGEDTRLGTQGEETPRVVDLMEALEASLAAVKKERATSDKDASAADEGDEVYARRCRRANAVMGEVGIKDDDERHATVYEATGGATSSTGRLLSWQVEAVANFCERLKPLAEPEGEGDNVGDVVGSAAPPPSGPVPGEWRARAAELGITDGQLLVKARNIATVLGKPLPTTVDEITDEQVIADLTEWLG